MSSAILWPSNTISAMSVSKLQIMTHVAIRFIKSSAIRCHATEMHTCLFCWIRALCEGSGCRPQGTPLADWIVLCNVHWGSTFTLVMVVCMCNIFPCVFFIWHMDTIPGTMRLDATNCNSFLSLMFVEVTLISNRYIQNIFNSFCCHSSSGELSSPRIVIYILFNMLCKMFNNLSGHA